MIKKAGKYWHFDYRYQSKRKTLALGVYPDVELKKAREKRNDARKLLANGIDPSLQRKKDKAILLEQSAHTFQVIAVEWYQKNKQVWVPSHSRSVKMGLNRYLFSEIVPLFFTA